MIASSFAMINIDNVDLTELDLNINYEGIVFIVNEDGSITV